MVLGACVSTNCACTIAPCSPLLAQFDALCKAAEFLPDIVAALACRSQCHTVSSLVSQGAHSIAKKCRHAGQRALNNKGAAPRLPLLHDALKYSHQIAS